MSVLTVTVDGTDIPYRQAYLSRGISPARPTPELKVRDVDAPVSPGDSITLSEGGTTLFTGQIARAKLQRGGAADLTCEHDLAPLFEESVDVPPTTSVQSALSSALSNASTAATLSFAGTDVTLGDDYQATDRPVRRIFRDLTERTGRVWRIDDPDTVVVEPLGAGPTIQIDTGTDTAVVDSFDPGDVRTVVNDVTVNGTGGERVTGTASDATSISTYGTRSETTNVSYIRTQGEAGAYADELLVPEPLAAADVRVGATVTDIVSDRTNAVIELTDPSRDIAGVQLVIEEQTNTSGGSAVFSAGEGARQDLVVRNRQAKSDEDKFEGDDLDKLKGNLDDVEDGSNFGKILQSAIDSGRHTLEAAVGDLDNIDDGGTFARVREGNVDSDNFVLLATSRGDLDDIDDGNDFGKVVTTALDAGEIILAEAVGDLDDIDDGSSFGKVSITNLTPGGAVFATGVELDDGRDLEDITVNDAQQGGATVIDGGELFTGSIEADKMRASTLTADEIDVLDLDTDQLSVGANAQGGWEFDTESFGGSTVATMVPFGDGALIGTDFDRPDAFLESITATGDVVLDGFDPDLDPGSDDTGSVGDTARAWSEMTAYDFIDATTGTAINDGGDPLAGLAEGHGPPDTCEVCDDETGETRGYSVNQMAREAWDIIRAQQRRLEDLEARLAALEGDTDPNA